MIIALAVITVGGVAFIAYMIGNKSSDKNMEDSANNETRNNRVIDGVVIRNDTAEYAPNPISSMTPVANSSQQWISTLPDRYQAHIRSLDRDTREWLMGMEPEDRMSYLRRAATRDIGSDVGNSASGNTGSLT